MSKTVKHSDEVIPGFGKRLQEVIDASYNGVALQLARALGGGEETQFRSRVSAWLDGKGGISGAHLLRLSKVTGVSAHYLLTGDGPAWSANVVSRSESLDSIRADKARLEKNLANRVSAQLVDLGIGADDLTIDAGKLLSHTADLIVNEIKQKAPAIEDGKAIFWHAFALEQLLDHVTGLGSPNEKVERLPVQRSAPIAKRHRAIITHGHTRLSDIRLYALRDVDSLYPGVSLEPYWQRLAAERENDPFVEQRALVHMESDEAKRRPLLTWENSGAAFTAAFAGDGRAKSRKQHSSNTSPTKTKKPRRK